MVTLLLIALLLVIAGALRFAWFVRSHPRLDGEVPVVEE